MVYIFHIAGDGHQGSPSGVQPLRRREANGEEGVWRPQYLESGI